VAFGARFAARPGYHRLLSPRLKREDVPWYSRSLLRLVQSFTALRLRRLKMTTVSQSGAYTLTLTLSLKGEGTVTDALTVS
jgi:hypothetical protein